jgi:hypothetical protein
MFMQLSGVDCSTCVRVCTGVLTLAATSLQLRVVPVLIVQMC